MAPFLFGPFSTSGVFSWQQNYVLQEFWRENLLDSGENNHFELKRIAFIKINLGCCDELA